MYFPKMEPSEIYEEIIWNIIWNKSDTKYFLVDQLRWFDSFCFPLELELIKQVELTWEKAVKSLLTQFECNWKMQKLCKALFIFNLAEKLNGEFFWLWAGISIKTNFGDKSTRAEQSVQPPRTFSLRVQMKTKIV